LHILYIHSAILTILLDTVKNPQNSTAHFKDLVMKCLWKCTKDFERWDDDLNYELVLERLHKFLKVIYTIYYVIENVYNAIFQFLKLCLLKLGN